MIDRPPPQSGSPQTTPNIIFMPMVAWPRKREFPNPCMLRYDAIQLFLACVTEKYPPYRTHPYYYNFGLLVSWAAISSYILSISFRNALAVCGRLSLRLFRVSIFSPEFRDAPEDLRRCQQLILDREWVDIQIAVLDHFKLVELVAPANLIQQLQECSLDARVTGGRLES